MTAGAPIERHWKAEAAIAAISFIWGATFVVVKDALNDASTFAFLALRFSMGTALLGFAVRSRMGRRPRELTRRQEWAGGLICGFLLFLGYALQTAGLRLTTASKSAFITGLYVVLVPLLGSLVQLNVPRWVDIAGAGLATVGTGLMSTTAFEYRLGSGDLLTAGCAVAFAAHILAVAHYSRRMDYERLSLYQVAWVATFSALLVVGWESPRVDWSSRLWVALLVTSVFATALTFLLYTWAQQHTTASRAALIFALEPVFAGVVAWLAAGENWTARSLAGAGLILAAIVWVEMQPRRAPDHPKG